MTWFRLMALLFIVVAMCSAVTRHEIRLDAIEDIINESMER